MRHKRAPLQVEGRIRAGPRADLDAFLAALVRLELSIAFFQKNRCGSWVWIHGVSAAAWCNMLSD